MGNQTKLDIRQLDTVGYRDTLTEDRDYYVRPDGSDGNTGLANTAGGAFLTIQKAVDVAVSLDLMGYNVVIHVADGVYTSPIMLKSYTGVGTYYDGYITIEGNTATPSNVSVEVDNTNALKGTAVNGHWRVKGLKLSTTTWGHCIYLDGGSTYVSLYNIEFGTATNCYHIYTVNGAFAEILTDTTIVGAAQLHYCASMRGMIWDGNDVTLSGVLDFSTAFAKADSEGVIWAYDGTFTGGTITGVRHIGYGNAFIHTGDGDMDTFFPGDKPGYLETGSVWDVPSDSGWEHAQGTWSYSSSGIVSVNKDMTKVISVGMKIRFLQSTTKYFVVTAVGSYSGGATLITLYGGTDYTLTSGAITCPYFSSSEAPRGFPTTPSKWPTTYAGGHVAASAAVHGLGSNVNVLGDRDGAGKYVQCGTFTNTTASDAGVTAAQRYYTIATVSFPVAFGSAPNVFLTQNSLSVHIDILLAYSITTSLFYSRGYSAQNSAGNETMAWLALGA